MFLSQSTGDHHQLVLAKGRPHDAGFTTVNQLSYKLDSLETLKAMYATIVHKPVKDLVQISHGNAWSIYFKDPEGNRVELFVDTPWYTPQPCREPLDLTKPVEQIVKETEEYCRSRPRFQNHGEWQRELKDKIAASRLAAPLTDSRDQANWRLGFVGPQGSRPVTGAPLRDGERVRFEPATGPGGPRATGVQRLSPFTKWPTSAAR